jgi:hypothetical protein
MLREKPKWKPHKDESTDAAYRGGTARTSVDASVMVAEQRGCIIHVLTIDQLCIKQRRNQWKEQNRLRFPSK